VVLAEAMMMNVKFMKQLGVGGAPIITVKAEVMRLILMEVGQIGTETNFYVLNLDYLVMRVGYLIFWLLKFNL